MGNCHPQQTLPPRPGVYPGVYWVHHFPGPPQNIAWHRGWKLTKLRITTVTGEHARMQGERFPRVTAANHMISCCHTCNSLPVTVRAASWSHAMVIVWLHAAGGAGTGGVPQNHLWSGVVAVQGDALWSLQHASDLRAPYGQSPG